MFIDNYFFQTDYPTLEILMVGGRGISPHHILKSKLTLKTYVMNLKTESVL